MATADAALDWRSAALTHPGKVRRLNEDEYLDRPGDGLWAVADGMGGHHAGDVASRKVVEALARVPPSTSLEQLIDACLVNLKAANLDLYLAGQGEGNKLSGATVVALLCHGEDAALLWAGDSRAYRLRGRGQQAKLEQLTTDHSRVAELVKRGELAEADAESHPDANVITRAVGVREGLELESKRLIVEPGDTFLLCSDGLSRYVGPADLATALEETMVASAARALQETALESPARDNITVVVARAAVAPDTRTVLNRVGGGHAPRDEDPTERNDDPPGRGDPTP
ncbi:MAG: protein phosphatase 2C domain-containing protein [Pseudomonadota bacterium]